MNDELPLDPRTIEALEAYRSGRDDLSEPVLGSLAARLADSPELAKLHGRIERVDEVLATVVRDVPTPEGLKQRILDRLAASPPRATDPVVTPAGGRRSRRHWLVASVASVVAAAAMIVVVGYWYLPAGHTRDEALDLAVAWFKDAGGRAGDPIPAVLTPLLREHPPSGDVILPAGTRWRVVDDFWGRRGVAYTMRGWNGSRATLFVVHWNRPVPGLNGNPCPPDFPMRTTGGVAAAAWQSDGLLYVLVVDGNQDTYRCFLTPRPIA